MQTKIVSSLDCSDPALRQVTRRVAAVGGINLGQGTCLIPTPEIVAERARRALLEGRHQYSAAHGVDELRAAICTKLNKFNRIPCSVENVCVTSGSSGAFEAVCGAFLDEGDEVAVFSPWYPYHIHAIKRSKAIVREIQLQMPDWTFDPNKLEELLNEKTKFLLLCNPSNPTGKTFTETELLEICDICKRHDVIVVTDEVYEYLTYDGQQHISVASLPGMFERTITMSSYSKTFAITGWRIGYFCAPESVFAKLRGVFDQKYICAPTPLQLGVAHGVSELQDSYYSSLVSSFERKRQILCEALTKTGFQVCKPPGAYYIIAYTSGVFGQLNSSDAVSKMIDETGVGAVPSSDFVSESTRHEDSLFVRFCFAMPDDMLLNAADRLSKLRNLKGVKG